MEKSSVDKMHIMNMDIYGLHTAIKEFNEENLNTVVKNIHYIISTKNLNRIHLNELIYTIENCLKEDYSFYSKDNEIYFQKTLVAFHRENDKLVKDLQKFTEEFFKIKKKTKFINLIEKKIPISVDMISFDISISDNITNLLKIIAVTYKENFVKY